MTRYEMAVLVNRAVNGLEAKIAAGDKVNADAIAAVRRLVNEFQNELKNVASRVDDLTKKTADLQKQADALAAAQKQFHFNMNFFYRPGTYDQSQTITNGPIGLARTPATGVPAAGGSALVLAPGVTAAVPAGSTLVAPFASLPGGSGSTATNGNGLGPSSYGTVSQNTALAGTYTRGTQYYNVRMIFSGNIDPRFAYAIRLTMSDRLPNGLGVSATSPGYCRGNGAAQNTATCAAADFGTTGPNLAVADDYAWLGYFSPGGLYFKAGRVSNGEGKYMSEAMYFGGGTIQGAMVGYTDPAGRIDTWVDFNFPSASVFNLQTANSLQGGTGLGTCTALLYNPSLGGGTVGNGVLNGFNLGCNNGAAVSNGNLQANFNYYFPSTRTNIAADWDTAYGDQATLWSPAAGLCETAAGASTAITLNTSVPCPAGSFYVATAAGPVTGAYIAGQASLTNGALSLSQFFGSYDHPQWRVWASYGRRMGSDPFTNAAWVGANEYYAGFAYSAKGKTVNGPIRPSTGIPGDNVVQLQFHYLGLNAQADTGFPGGGASLDQQYISNGNNMISTNLEYVHWFTSNIYLGVFWNHYNTFAPVPAGGAACPGCSLQMNANAFGLNSWSYF
jgi:hypothetical protein